MADATSKKLLRLARPDQPGPLRRAALVVLGEIGPRDKEVSDILCAALDDTDPEVRTEAVTAVGKLRIDRALPQLIARVSIGGPEADGAVQAAAQLGAKGVKALQDLMTQTAPGLRRRIAGALGASHTASAEAAAVDALLDNDAGVVDAAARSLIAEVPSLSEKERHSLADHILELLAPKKKGAVLSAASEAALVRLLSALNDPRAEPVFWARTEAPHPPELRAAALQALGTLPAPSGVTPLKRLLACAAEPDFRVAAPALMILKGLPVSAKNLKDWLPLLEAADVAARRFAIDKLGGNDTAEVAAALLPQLKHADRGLREQAMTCLAKLEHGREALASELLEAATADEAWVLARAQAPLVRDASKALRNKVFTRASAYLEAEDRRADALLFLLREADAKDLRDRLTEQAMALRKKKKYPEALVYLRLLGRDPALGEELRFELAACGLKESAHDLSAEARAADPCLPQFARLVHSHATEPIEYVKKAAWLGPEDWFYLGFHFVEGRGPEKEFGGKLLQMVVKKTPRTQLGKDARSKLRSAGID